MSAPHTTFLDLVAACDNFSYDSDAADLYYKLYLPRDEQAHGLMHPDIVAMIPWPSVFLVDFPKRTVTIRDAGNEASTSKTCNIAIQQLADILVGRKGSETAAGHRSECFDIPGALYPVHIRRAAVTCFGTTVRSAHLTAYTRTSEGNLQVWVAQRSLTQDGIYRCEFNTIVADGVQDYERPYQTILREATEKASLYWPLVQLLMKSSGVLTYVHGTNAPLFPEKCFVKPVMVYMYDIELPETIVPMSKDGTLSAFLCLNTWELQRALRSGAFDLQSAVVLIDFLIRHGIIHPDNEQNFAEICMRLHRRLPFPVTKKR